MCPFCLGQQIFGDRDWDRETLTSWHRTRLYRCNRTLRVIRSTAVDGVEGTEQPVSAPLQPVQVSGPSALVSSGGPVLATAGSSSTVPATRGSLIHLAPPHSANNDDDVHMTRADKVRMECLRANLAEELARGPEATLNELFAAYPRDSGINNHDPMRKPKKHIVCAQCECFTHSLDRLAVRFSSRTALKKHEHVFHVTVISLLH